VLGPADERALFVVAADVGSPLAAMAGRLAGRLPAHWSAFAIERDVAERTVAYACGRRTAGQHDVSCCCTVRVGGRVEHDLTDRFLLDRAWRFTAGRRGRVRRLGLAEPSWPLHDAVLELLDDRLLAAAGLPEPQGRMVVRFSAGAEVGTRGAFRRVP
jgi:uncharacterized protein YqjF (DUF2071 family)